MAERSGSARPQAIKERYRGYRLGVKRLSCPFSRVPDAKSLPVIFVPVADFDAGMRGGGRALSDG